MNTESPEQKDFKDNLIYIEASKNLNMQHVMRTLEMLSLPHDYLLEYNSILEKVNELFPIPVESEDTIRKIVQTFSFSPQSSYDWTMLDCLTIAFEGIDATGKQTLSGMLKTFLEFTNCYNSFVVNNFYMNLSPDQQFIKVNIPNYESASGIRIRHYLNEGNYDPKLLQLEFAINRREVQNLLENYNRKVHVVSGGLEQTKVCIFDRWVDSGVAFKLAKVLVSEARVGDKIDHLNKVQMETLLDKNRLEMFLQTSYGESLWREYIEGQEEIEYHTLGLVKPMFKVLCISPTSIISDRLHQRAIASGIPLDQHEKDLEFLDVVQNVYEINFRQQFKNHNQKYLVLDTSTMTKEVCVAEILYKLATVLKNHEPEETDFGNSFSELCKLSEQINNL